MGSPATSLGCLLLKNKHFSIHFLFLSINSQHSSVEIILLEHFFNPVAGALNLTRFKMELIGLIDRSYRCISRQLD